MSDSTHRVPSLKSELSFALITQSAILVSASVILVLVGGWFAFSVASPLNRRSAIRTTLEWARLAPFGGDSLDPDQWTLLGRVQR